MSQLGLAEQHALHQGFATRVSAAAAQFRANIVEIDLDKVSQPLLDECRRRGLKIMIRYEGKDPAAFQAVLRWGVDMINLDYGDLFLKIAAAYAQEREN
jgi:hypothetical protein